MAENNNSNSNSNISNTSLIALVIPMIDTAIIKEETVIDKVVVVVDIVDMVVVVDIVEEMMIERDLVCVLEAEVQRVIKTVHTIMVDVEIDPEIVAEETDINKQFQYLHTTPLFFFIYSFYTYIYKRSFFFSLFSSMQVRKNTTQMMTFFFFWIIIQHLRIYITIINAIHKNDLFTGWYFY